MEGSEAYMLLPGERFCPMEDELILHYLIPKVKNLPVPGGITLIPHVDLYDKKKEPWQIWEEHRGGRENDLRKNKDLYFFTKLKKASEKGGDRFARGVGEGGTWKGQTKGAEIFLCDKNGKNITNPKTLLGIRKNYTYKKENSDQEGCWIIYEYELRASPFISESEIEANKDVVLCRLKKNDKSTERKRKKQGGNNEEQHLNNINGGDDVNAIVTQEVDQRLQPIHNYQQQIEGYNNHYNPSSEPQQSSEGYLGQQYEMPMENSNYYTPEELLPLLLQEDCNTTLEPQPLQTIDYSGQPSHMTMTTTTTNYSDNNVKSGDDDVSGQQVYDDQVNQTGGDEL